MCSNNSVDEAKTGERKSQIHDGCYVILCYTEYPQRSKRYYILTDLLNKWVVFFSLINSMMIAPLIKFSFLLLLIFVCRFVRGGIFSSALF